MAWRAAWRGGTAASAQVQQRARGDCVRPHAQSAALAVPQLAAPAASLRALAALGTAEERLSRSGPSGGVAHAVPLYTQVLEAQLLVQPGGSIQLQVQWLDALPSERLGGSCGGCAHLTGGEASPPYHYGALLARAFAEPLAVPELRVRQIAAAAAGCDRSWTQTDGTSEKS